MSHKDLPLLQDAPAGDLRQLELVERVMRHAPADGVHATAIGPLHLIRASAPSAVLPSVYEPGVCIVVQGSKQALLGGHVFRYDPLNYLIISVTLPVVAQILEASVDRPYLCVRIDVDPKEVGALMLETNGDARFDAGNGRAAGSGNGAVVNGQGDAANGAGADERGLRVARVSDPLLDATLRLLRLLDTPRDIAVLAPLALREIQYRVLTGELGPRLRQLVLGDTHLRRVARAIDLIKRRYAETLRVEELAQAAHMSESSLHHHFKEVTARTPLQFQKELRLHHARRLMLAEGLEASAAAHRVGYESASQFSRDYRRLFGAPPRTEIEGLLRAARA